MLIQLYPTTANFILALELLSVLKKLTNLFHQSTKEDKRNGVTVYMKAILKNPLFHGFNVSVNTKKVKRDKYVKIQQLYSLFFRK